VGKRKKKEKFPVSQYDDTNIPEKGDKTKVVDRMEFDEAKKKINQEKTKPGLIKPVAAKSAKVRAWGGTGSYRGG